MLGQVSSSGVLTLAGNTAIRHKSKSKSKSTPPPPPPPPPPSTSASSSASPPAVRNLGVLSLPRGFSLTVAGGIEQGPRGEAVVALPAPLYAPSPASDSGNISSSSLSWLFSGDRSGGDLLGDGVGEEAFGDRFGGKPFGDRFGDVSGGSAENWGGYRCRGEERCGSGVGGFGVRAGGGGGRHPLVVESGVARLQGAFNASVARGGGEDERWAVVGSCSRRCSRNANASCLVFVCG